MLIQKLSLSIWNRLNNKECDGQLQQGIYYQGKQANCENLYILTELEAHKWETETE